MCACVSVCACVPACVLACVRAYVCAHFLLNVEQRQTDRHEKRDSIHMFSLDLYQLQGAVSSE